jgi:hypothetical protein
LQIGGDDETSAIGQLDDPRHDVTILRSGRQRTHFCAMLSPDD